MRYLLMAAIIVAGIVAFGWVYLDVEQSSRLETDKNGPDLDSAQQFVGKELSAPRRKDGSPGD